jgi:hypothetical protein
LYQQAIIWVFSDEKTIFHFVSKNKSSFPFGKEKLVAPLIAIPNVDKANRRQEKGKRLN